MLKIFLQVFFMTFSQFSSKLTHDLFRTFSPPFFYNLFMTCSSFFYKSRKERILVVQICFIWLTYKSQSSATNYMKLQILFTNSSKPNWNFGLPYKFSSSCCHLCLQEENNSDLLLRLAPSGWKMMWYFSFKHRLHFLFIGLNFLPLSIILHFKL